MDDDNSLKWIITLAASGRAWWAEPGSPIENLSQHSLIPSTFFLLLPTAPGDRGPARHLLVSYSRNSMIRIISIVKSWVSAARAFNLWSIYFYWACLMLRWFICYYAYLTIPHCSLYISTHISSSLRIYISLHLRETLKWKHLNIIIDWSSPDTVDWLWQCGVSVEIQAPDNLSMARMSLQMLSPAAHWAHPYQHHHDTVTGVYSDEYSQPRDDVILWYVLQGGVAYFGM